MPGIDLPADEGCAGMNPPLPEIGPELPLGIGRGPPDVGGPSDGEGMLGADIPMPGAE